MKTLFFLLLNLFFISTGIAHNVVTGKVVDKNTGSPLVGANVMVTGTYYGTVTDQFGSFILKTDTVIQSLTVSFVGYKTQIILIKKPSEHLLIEMIPVALELSQVVVTTSAVNNLKTLSRVDADLRAANSSQDVLRIVPGLFIAQHAGGGKAEQIFLRGIDNDHGTDIDISVDGIPVNMVSHAHGQGYADLHFLIPELIRTVDFGKGPYYTEHGDFNTSGYISFKTPEHLDQSLIKLEGGMFNTLRGVALINLLGGKESHKNQSAYMASELMLTNGPFKSPQNFIRMNFFGKYTNYIDQNTRLTFEFSKLQSKWDASGQIPQRAVNEGLIGRFGALDPTEGGFTGRTNFMIQYIKELPKGASFENQFYFSDYYFELYSNFTFFLKNPMDGDQIRQKEHRHLYGYKTRYKFNRSLGAFSSETTFGGGFRYDDIDHIELSNTKKRITIKPMALGDIDETNLYGYVNETLLKNKWVLNLGLRGDFFKFDYNNRLDSLYHTDSKSKARLSPKMNILFNLNSQLQFYLKSGIGFHSNDTRVILSGKSGKILPAAYGTDLGTLFKLGHRFLGQAALWYLYMQDELVYVGDDAVVEPGGRTTRFGLDLSVRYQFTKWLLGDVDVNLAHPRYPDDPEGANFVPLAPGFTSVGGLTVKHPSGFNGSIRYRYMKDRPANEDNTVTAFGYTVVDLVLNYKKPKYEIGLTIENLFNTEWNEAQFDTETRLYNESAPISELCFTPGTPFFLKGKISFFF